MNIFNNLKINNKNKIFKIIIILIIIFLIMIAYYFFSKINEEEIFNFNELENSENNKEKNNEKINDKNDEKNNYENNEENKINNKMNNKLKIHMAGSVENEGVFEVDENSRIIDAINIAGGLKEDADISKINLATIVEDGMKIYIPNINEKYSENNLVNNFYENIGKNNYENSEKENNNNLKNKLNKKININTANQTELENLPGIGNQTALKIVTYRNEKGKFENIEDIKNVSGIGSSKFDKIKEFICVK